MKTLSPIHVPSMIQTSSAAVFTVLNCTRHGAIRDPVGLIKYSKLLGLSYLVHLEHPIIIIMVMVDLV